MLSMENTAKVDNELTSIKMLVPQMDAYKDDETMLYTLLAKVQGNIDVIKRIVDDKIMGNDESDE